LTSGSAALHRDLRERLAAAEASLTELLRLAGQAGREGVVEVVTARVRQKWAEQIRAATALPGPDFVTEAGA
jgi:hypothetical protein